MVPFLPNAKCLVIFQNVFFKLCPVDTLLTKHPAMDTAGQLGKLLWEDRESLSLMAKPHQPDRKKLATLVMGSHHA